MITRTVFNEVKHYARKSGNCPTCGKPVTRSRVFMQTLNPYNRNEEGRVKSRDEIRAELRVEAEEWEPDFRHQREECRG